jgi:hypothetical protein
LPPSPATFFQLLAPPVALATGVHFLLCFSSFILSLKPSS